MHAHYEVLNIKASMSKLVIRPKNDPRDTLAEPLEPGQTNTNCDLEFELFEPVSPSIMWPNYVPLSRCMCVCAYDLLVYPKPWTTLTNPFVVTHIYMQKLIWYFQKVFFQWNKKLFV